MVAPRLESLPERIPLQPGLLQVEERHRLDGQQRSTRCKQRDQLRSKFDGRLSFGGQETRSKDGPCSPTMVRRGSRQHDVTPYSVMRTPPVTLDQQKHGLASRSAPPRQHPASVRLITPPSAPAPTTQRVHQT